MSTIQPSQLLVTSSDVILDKKAEGTERLSNLRKGQIVEAKVLRVLSGRRSQIQIKGETVTAKTYLPLREGQSLLLKVDRTGSQHVLKFVGEKPGQTIDSHLALLKPWGKSGPYRLLPKLMAQLSDLPGGSDPLRSNDLLLKINSLLGRMALKSSDVSPQFLKSLIQGSGLVWETKLVSALMPDKGLTPAAVQALISGDLKGFSLQMLGEQPNDADPVMNQLKSFIDGLEKQQLFNQQNFEKFGKYLLPLPVFLSPRYEFGQLLLDLGGGADDKKKEKELVNVSFLLSLTRLGDFRADFSIYKKSISGVFGVANEEVHELVNHWTPGLIDKLKNNGFTVYNVSCKVLGPETLSGMTLLDQAVSAHTDGLLNLII
jgi:hypothetical protein